MTKELLDVLSTFLCCAAEPESQNLYEWQQSEWLITEIGAV